MRRIAKGKTLEPPFIFSAACVPFGRTELALFDPVLEKKGLEYPYSFSESTENKLHIFDRVTLIMRIISFILLMKKHVILT